MLKSYFKIAIRNLTKNPAYSLINVLGLAIGTACCIIMLLYVQDELSFDLFHSKSDRIYRLIETERGTDGTDNHLAFTVGPAGPAIVHNLPEFVKSVRLRSRYGIGRFTMVYAENRFIEGAAVITEPSFFEIFDFPMVAGNAETALNAPNSIVLTERAARRYFGSIDPVGKLLDTDRFGPLTVTGVVNNPPAHSHLDFDVLISFATLPAQSPNWQRFIDSWESSGFATYLLAERAIDLAAVQEKITQLARQHRDAASAPLQLSLQALRDVHFHSAHINTDFNANKGQPAYAAIFAVIALLVLLIACINYMNLSTARSMKRSREIGMRKVVGAAKKQLIAQFLSESVLLSGIALIIAIAIAQLVLPMFNALAGRELQLFASANPLFAIILLLLMLFVGIVAGSYPAFYLSRLNPAVVFKGDKQAGGGGAFFRRVLVVTQFALSIIMIVSTVVAYKQLNFIRTKNLGFDQQHLITIDINSGAARRSFEAMRAEMANLSGVQTVSVSSRVPGEWKNIMEVAAVPESAGENEARTLNFIGIDDRFLETFDIELLAGRNLSGLMGTDTSAILINEATARLFGWQEPLGKVLVMPEEDYRVQIVGIVKDFHFQSLHEQIAPLILGHWSNPIQSIDYFTCRVETASMPHILEALEAIHGRYDKVSPMEYNFIDDRLNDFYQRDIRVGKIFAIAATLTILIACLGLFGLAAFTAEQRTKEIGVRKVMGATVPNIVLLVSNDFIKLVVYATVIASPLAWLALNRWLENFAYRIAIGIDTFVIAGLVALLIAVLTVSSQAIKAALANPIDALRYE